jgi:hypothetical protein
MVICAAILMSGTRASAQDISGSISGTVRAASGAVVKGATVTVTETHRNQLVRTVTTDAQGFYAASKLQPGTYTEKVTADNFAVSVVTGIVVHASDALRFDLKLKAGTASESVTVMASKTQLNTADAASADLVSSLQVHSLPLNNDNYLVLANLVPGTTSVGPDAPYAGDTIAGAPALGFAIQGHGGSYAYWTLDGADNVDHALNKTTLNFPAATNISEVKVLRGNYSAIYGRTIGAQVEVTTKSGTNELHGSLYEHFRSDYLNADSFISKAANPVVPTAESRYNEFGGSIGGPVVIANTYNGRNRTFFFVSANILRNVSATPLTTFEPLPTEVGLATPGSYTFANTVCTATNSTTGACTATGNSIATVSSVTAKAYISNIFANMPAPNPSPLQDAHSLTYNAKGYYNNEEEIARLDHRFNAKLNVSYRYLHDSLPSNGANGPFADPTDLPGVNYNKAVSPATNHMGRLTYVRSPKTLFEFNYSFSTNAILSNPDGLIAKANSASIAPTLPYANLLGVVPTLNFQNGPTLTGTGIYRQQNQNHTINGTMTKVWKTHTVVIGGTAYHMEHIASAPTLNAGAYSFNGVNAPTGSSSAVLFQQSIANFLQGVANGGFTQTNFPMVVDLVSMQEEGFAQDTWRASKQLTVSLGARYSHFLQPTDNNGNLSTFLPSSFVTANEPTITAATGLLASTQSNANLDPLNGINLGNYSSANSHYSKYGAEVAYTDKLDFAPRLGLAYDVFGNGKTVVHAGYGWAFDDPAFSIYDQAVFNNEPYIRTTTYAVTSIDTIAVNDPSTQSAGTEMPPTLWATPRSMHMPYSQQYNVSVQSVLPLGLFAEVGFAGTHDTHLLGLVDINEVPAGLAASAAGVQPTGGFTSPYSEVKLNAPQNVGTTLTAMRPYVGYAAINSLQSSFNANYNALQAKLQKRLKHDSLIDVNYTWSRSMTNSTADRGGAVQNSYYLTPEYGRSPFDRKQVLTADGVYALPWLAGRKDYVGYALGGWHVSGILTLASGSPLTATISNLDSAGLGALFTSAAQLRPNQVGNPNYATTANPNIHYHAQWFNPAAFTLPTVCTAASSAMAPCFPGNEHPGTITGSGISRVDVALYKDFKVEWASIQFRAEAYNIANHTNWTTISTNYNSVNFGQPTGARDPRVIQLDLTAHF